MTDSEIVKEIDSALERRGLRVYIEAYGPPLEEVMSKEAMELWKSLGCAGEDNCRQVIVISNCDAPESVKNELLKFFLNNNKEIAEDKVYAYKTIAEWWMDYKSEDTPCVADPVRVEIDDGSVKKLADATGKSVKKAIKPGKGSANACFTPETKEKCRRIYDTYKDKPEVKQHAYKRKVSHADVFEYAKDELANLQPPCQPIHSADEFRRALGALSDRKHRESLAKMKKPR